MYKNWGSSNYKSNVSIYEKSILNNDVNQIMEILDKMSAHSVTRKEYSEIINFRFAGNMSCFRILYHYFEECQTNGP